MTPTGAEALLIELWNEGLEIATIAQRLGIPKGTVQSRAHRLQQRGLIQPRPKGGAYPRQKALARQEDTPPPVQRPLQSTDTGADHDTDPLPTRQSRALEPVDLGCHPR